MGLRVEVVDSADGLATLTVPWNALVHRTGASLFQTFEWASAWLECFGSGRVIRIVLVWENDRLVGLAPFFLERPVRLRPLGRTLRIVGSYRSHFLDLLAEPGREREVTWDVARVLAAFGDWEAMWLANVPAVSPTLAPFLEALAAHGCRCLPVRRSPSLVLMLPSTWGEYAQRLSKRTRAKLQTHCQRAEEAGFDFHVVDGSQPIAEALATFEQIHEARARKKGWENEPRVKRFRARVCHTLQARGWTRFTFLGRNSECIACDISFFDPATRRGWGYRCGHAPGWWEKFAPGIILRFKVIADAIADGVSAYFEGGERGGYLHRFKPKVHEIVACQVIAPSQRAKLRWRIEQGGRETLRAIHRLRT